MKFKSSVVENSIKKRLEEMAKSSQDARPILNKTIYQLYQNVQRERWMTENKSQGKQWADLNPKYAQYKLKKFASFPGAGKKKLIATGRLYQSVIGPHSEHRKLVEPKRLIVSTSVPYAVYVDEDRTFSTFNKATINNMKKIISDYLMKGKT